MPRETLFPPVGDDALGTESNGAIVRLVLGLVLFAGGLVLLIACVTELASPASAAGGNAPLAIGHQRALSLLTLHGREIEEAECERSARDHSACVNQEVGTAPALRRMAPATPSKPPEDCSAGNARHDAEGGSISLDLRCDLTAMAASQRHARFVYVDPR
jgi:hypothetical protein